MNHAITVGGLLLVLGAIVSIPAFLFGLLMIFAGGMSNSPTEGESAASSGCLVTIISAIVLIGCVAGLIF
jgi:uncharacterized membrane protein YphA (DoxX/SURF4 family)